MSSITFFGAAGSVTGSKHLVSIADKNILLDCGMFQGLPDVRNRNRAFPFDPDSIDAVVLSHAHLDHCGMLPLLVKRGYKGSIFATRATQEVTSYILEDSAGIEEQDVMYKRKHHIGSPDERELLFTRDDVEATMKHFVPIPYARSRDGWKEILPGISVKLYDAGHILGSSIIVLRYSEGGKMRHIAYTGDVGPNGVPMLHDPEVPQEEIHTLLMESTYGNRKHLPMEEAQERLVKAINAVCERKGAMVVPAFSLGRTQMLVYTIHKMVDAGRIPRFPIFVDSPLATDITNIYKHYTAEYDSETATDFTRPGESPLAFRNLEYIQSAEDSKKLNGRVGPFMVISASGMMTAGRVVHHLRNTISDKKNAVFITGYQAIGTTGRRILEGAKHIELHGTFVPIHAEILLFNEFSAHADGEQLTDFASQVHGLSKIALVHGEPKESQALQAGLQKKNANWNVILPQEGESISI
ncbi:MAG TPA: MBL fold metallo-hydrolase [Candidatus Andersenbacteria bacterium]|nr:MBL fold metallo-hydrolase [Candidatus Andersenbacteria bacterium]